MGEKVAIAGEKVAIAGEKVAIAICYHFTHAVYRYAEKGTQKVLKITLVNTAHFLSKKR